MNKLATVLLILLWPFSHSLGLTTLSISPQSENLYSFGYLFAIAFFSAPEVLVTTTTLTYSRMNFGYTFIGFFIINMVVILFVRRSIIEWLDYDHVFLADIAVTFVDTVLIKAMSYLDLFQTFEFENLKWKYAFLAAALGNTVTGVLFWLL